MQVTTDCSGDVGFAAVSGRVDSSTAGAFEAALLAALDESGHRMVLDCAALEFLSSAGLRALLVAMKKANAAHGDMVMCGVPERIREVLEVSGFTRFLKLFAAADEARASLAT